MSQLGKDFPDFLLYALSVVHCDNQMGSDYYRISNGHMRSRSFRSSGFFFASFIHWRVPWSDSMTGKDFGSHDR